MFFINKGRSSMEIKSNYDMQAEKCKLEFIKIYHQRIAKKFSGKINDLIEDSEFPAECKIL